MDKKSIRKKLRHILSEISMDQRLKISKSISTNLSNLLKDLNSQKIVNDQIIGGFSPMPDEFEWYLDKSLDDFHFALPTMLNKEEMEFQKFNISEIRNCFQGLVLKSDYEVVRPKIFIIPGLGFSKDFKRIGRGKGYYDRYLAKDESCLKIGICSELQFLEFLPSEDFDIEMNYIITDEKIYRRGI